MNTAERELAAVMAEHDERPDTDALSRWARAKDRSRQGGLRRWWPVAAAVLVIAIIAGAVLVARRAPVGPASRTVPSTSGWVQLGSYDVKQRTLDAPGGLLTSLLGAAGAADVDDMSGPPPLDGWRVISGKIADNHVVIAAPWTDRGPGAWMLVDAHRLHGRWSTVVDTPEKMVRPGRVDRRAGLTLSCAPGQQELIQGEPVQLLARLTNQGSTWWTGDGQDFDYVSGRITPAAGAPLANLPWDGEARLVKALPELKPRHALDRQIWLENARIEQLPPGTYTLTATLTDLDLSCPPVQITIKPAQ